MQLIPLLIISSKGHRRGLHSSSISWVLSTEKYLMDPQKSHTLKKNLFKGKTKKKRDKFIHVPMESARYDALPR